VKQGSEKRFLVVVATVWSVAALTLFPHLSGAASAASGDAERGKQLFEKRCTGCHSLDKNKEGPRLRGVFGRKAGTLADFSYSDELKASQIMWDEQSLDRWLINPDAMVSNSDMAFHVSDPKERADIIQFLRLSSGK
jgi:cytochrome c